MRNICLILTYDGTDYVGWQVQHNGLSVQEVVQDAIFKLTQERVSLIVAGRTDSGVHALGQTANFHSSTTIPCEKMRLGLQRYLPPDIVVKDVRDVSPDFHATYSAIAKRYRYVVLNAQRPDPFLRRLAWYYHRKLDVAAMHEAAQRLLGQHDFRCFESQFPNKATSVRTISDAEVTYQPGWHVWENNQSLTGNASTVEPYDAAGPYICFDVKADGFLYNMVRAIMGTLIKVGVGTWNADDLTKIIENQNRSLAGETAPPQGLYLVHVDYDEFASEPE